VNGARPFTATELTALREHAGQDLFTLLVLRWTGLRGSDAINLRWRDIRFDRGVNGEIEVLTQKRSKIAIVPLSTELRNALEDVAGARYGRKIQHDDFVLYNPETNKPFVSRRVVPPHRDVGCSCKGRAGDAALFARYVCLRHVGA
jgi:integrase